MTVNILIAEHFRFFSVGNDFFGILFVDLVILAFTDFARCEVIAVSVGITVPGKILPFPIDRSVSAAKPYLIRNNTKAIFGSTEKLFHERVV